jgi:ABC-type transporter Mla MlaB component
MGACELIMDNGQGVLALSGSFGVAEAGLLHRSLVEAMAACPAPALDLGKVEDVDVSFMQLLCAAEVGLRRRGLGLECPGGVPLRLAEAAERAGFALGGSQGCFWKREERA